jgi:hypothetical protein
MVTRTSSVITSQARTHSPGTTPDQNIYAKFAECGQCQWVADPNGPKGAKMRLKYLTPACTAGHWAKYAPGA